MERSSRKKWLLKKRTHSSTARGREGRSLGAQHGSELASQCDDQRRGQERRCERAPFPEEPGGDGMGTEGNGVRGDMNPGEAQGAGTRQRGGRRAGGARGPASSSSTGATGPPAGDRAQTDAPRWAAPRPPRSSASSPPPRGCVLSPPDAISVAPQLFALGGHRLLLPVHARSQKSTGGGGSRTDYRNPTCFL